MEEDLMETPFEGPTPRGRLHSPTQRTSWNELDEAEVRRRVAKLVVFGFNGKTINSHARKLISLGAGGVVLFARNVEDPYQVARLCADLKSVAGSRPLITMVDQEGGRVQRLGGPFTAIPAARKIGSTDDVAAAGAIGSVIGRELRSVYLDMDLAPVLDVDTLPPNPVMSDRCFGCVPYVVSEMGYAFIRALQREGVAACAKHYPGLGRCSTDSHLDLPSFSGPVKDLIAVDIPPFRKAVEADVAAVMVGHIDVPSLMTGIEDEQDIIGQREVRSPLPATLSKSAIAYLRNELLFEGLVMSDSLEMGAVAKTLPIEEAAVQAVAAGVDMVMVCHKEGAQTAVIDSLAKAVLDGRLSYDRVNEAGSRIDKLAQTFCERILRRGEPLEGGYQQARMDCIGSKEHRDLVANVLHHPALTQ